MNRNDKIIKNTKNKLDELNNQFFLSTEPFVEVYVNSKMNLSEKKYTRELNFIENRLMKINQLSLNGRVMINKVLRIALYVIAVVIALDTIGLDLTFLSVFGGAFGVGLAFGMQKIASNYISGFTILLYNILYYIYQKKFIQY